MEDGSAQACPHCAVLCHPTHMQGHLKQCNAQDLEVNDVSPLRQLSPMSPLLRSRNNEEYFKNLALQDSDMLEPNLMSAERLKSNYQTADGLPKAAPSGLPRSGVQTYRAPETEALLATSESDVI